MSCEKHTTDWRKKYRKEINTSSNWSNISLNKTQSLSLNLKVRFPCQRILTPPKLSTTSQTETNLLKTHTMSGFRCKISSEGRLDLPKSRLFSIQSTRPTRILSSAVSTTSLRWVETQCAINVIKASATKRKPGLASTLIAPTRQKASVSSVTWTCGGAPQTGNVSRQIQLWAVPNQTRNISWKIQRL